MPDKKSTDKNQTLINGNSLPVGVVIFDSRFRVTFINQTMLTFGLLNEEVANFSKGVTLDNTPLFENIDLITQIRSLLDGMPFEKEIKRISSGRKNLSLICKGVPVLNGDKITGGLIMVEDIRMIPEVEMDPRFSPFRTGEILTELLDLVFVCDSAGKVLFYGGHRLSNYFSPNSVIAGKNLTSLEGFTNYITGSPDEVVTITKDGVSSEVRLRSAGFTGTDGSELTIITGEDVSTNREMIKALEEQIKELRDYSLIAEKGGIAIFSVDTENRINSWSKEAEIFFGYKKIEIFGKNATSLIKQFRWSPKGGVFRSAYTSHAGTGSGEFRVINAQGSTWVLCRDIMEDEKEKRELLLKNRQYSAFLNTSRDMICQFDSELNILNSNDRFDQKIITSGKRDEKKLTDIFAGYIPDTALIIKESPLIINAGVKDSSGKVFPAEVSFVYFEDEDQIVSSFACLIRDISSEEKTQQDILLMQSVFEASNDGIAVEESGNLIFVNNSFVRIFEYESELEIIGKPVGNFVRSGQRDDGDTVESEGLKKDGSIFTAEVSGASFEFNEKMFGVLIVRDITHLRNAQKLIEDSEAKYRSIAENIDDFLWVSEPVGGILTPVFVTSSFVAMTGYKTTEFTNNSRFWFRIIHPEDIDGYFSDLKDLLRNKYKSGGSLEVRIITKNGTSIWIRNKISFVREGDRIVKMFGLVSDITKQKQAENEIRESTENLKKLNDAKDRFISIISHDMRTPFSSILGFTDFLLTEDLSADEMKKYVTYIQDSTKIMLSLVNSLLDWTRLQTGRMKFEPVKQDLRTITSKSFSAVSGAAFQKDIELVNEMPENVVVFVDQNLILQVFNNLFSNAIKFTPNGGRITAGITGNLSGRFLEVFVRDSGVGIKEGDIQKIFHVDSKFTTPGTAGEKGTGLGLSLVKEIVEKHGGEITLTSKVGEGTRFTFTIPVASSRIALVESSPTDRVLYAKIITNLLPGYEVEQYKDIESATRSITTSVPAVVVTGHSFDGKTGLDLISEINSDPSRARIPFIVLGSNMGKSENIAYSEAGAEAIFNKPVNLQKFKEAIQNAVKTIFTLKDIIKR